ncbi:MAG: CDP-diacylglycerol--serine O-phosphatidyltransferase [Rubripirellula sp.]
MSELKRGLHGHPDFRDDDGAAENSDLLDSADSEVSEDSSESSDKRRFGLRKKKGIKKRRRLTLAVLPTALTLGNGVCGMTAIAVIIGVNLNWELDTKLLVAGSLIFGGMLFDALDGSAARMTGQESQFGAELDSLCDAITFGAAPAVIVWRIGDGLGAAQFIHPKVTWAIGVLFTLCVLIRLARFNVETTEEDTHEGFEGLPSPAAAGTLAAFAIALPELKALAMSLDPDHVMYMLVGSQLFIVALALVLAYLMVSRFQYPHVFQRLLRGRRNLQQIGQAMFIVIGAVWFYWLAMPIAFCYYAFASPTRALIQRYRQRELPNPEQ